MLAQITRFINCHKRKFVVTGLVIGGTFLSLQYIKRKFIELQNQKSQQFLEHSRRMQHYESTERTCNQAIVGISTKLCDQIIKILNTNNILEELKNQPENKVELWNELKVVCFTKLTTFVYATSMLVITLRIQLNLLGGYLYKDTTTPTNIKISEENRQAYLSLIQYFLSEGILKLIELIDKKVREIMKSYSLMQNFTLADIEKVFWSIQIAINSHFKDRNPLFSKYVLPPRNNDNSILSIMFSETLDVLESDDVTALFLNNISNGYSVVVDNISEYYTEINQDHGDNKSVDNLSDNKNIIYINRIKIPLARLIPILNGLTSKCVDNTKKHQNLATALSTFYLISDQIKLLGGNVYEVFSG